MQMPVLTRLAAVVGVLTLAAVLTLAPRAPLASAQQVGPLAITQSVQPTTAVPATAVPTTAVPATVTPTPNSGSPTPTATEGTTQTPTDVATLVPTEAPTSPSEDRTGNVALAKSADPTEARVGDTVTFSILVTNPSRYDTPRVVLTDDLPGYFELLSVRSSRGTPAVSGNTITIDLDTVVSGEEIAVTIQVRVLEGAPALMVNVATLTSPNSSDSASDNISRAEVRRIDDMASAPRPAETGTATALPTGVAGVGTPTATPAGAGVQPTPRRPGRLPRTGEEDPAALVLLLIGLSMAVVAGGMLIRRRA